MNGYIHDIISGVPQGRMAVYSSTTLKIVLVGDSGVGKSCMLQRYADNMFTESFQTTIGVDFRFKNIIVDGKNIKLQIWDTAGQEKFHALTSAYYRESDGIIMVYDISCRDSFTHMNSWIESAKN